MRFNWRFIVLFLVVGVFCLSCNKEEHKDPLHTTHIKYFGFTLIDTFWDDPTDTEIKTNYANEVYTFSNIADILVTSPTDNIVERMNVFSSLQLKSILHLNELFFENTGINAPSGTKYSLRNDFKERWNQFVTINDLQFHIENVQAFYIGEEPTWNAISFSELKAATDYVKSLFPNIPILIIEASSAIEDLEIPVSVDWIGFDHYFVKDPANNAQFLNELNVLKSKMNATQYLVFIMDTHYIKSVHGDIAGIEINDMKAIAKSYFDLAKKEPKTIAILGYFWPSGFDNLESIGARNMPQQVKGEYIRIGKIVTNKE